MRMNASSRLTKNKARIRRYEELASQEFDTAEDNLAIQIPHGRRLGNKVVAARNVASSLSATGSVLGSFTVRGFLCVPLTKNS